MELSYEKMWEAVVAEGLVTRFGALRDTFVMALAVQGKSRRSGEDLENDIKELTTMVTTNSADAILRKLIQPTDTYKHCICQHKDFIISYWANTSEDRFQEIKEDVALDTFNGINDPSAICLSEIAVLPDSSNKVTDNQKSFSTILIFETRSELQKNETVYVSVWKHELAHCLLFNFMNIWKDEIFKQNYTELHPNWSEEYRIEHIEQLQAFYDILTNEESKTEWTRSFEEFICDFLPFEVNGQINNVSPLDLFQEHMNQYITDKDIVDKYNVFIGALRPLYNDYTGFINRIK